MEIKRKNKKLGFGKRFYRRIARPKGLISFHVAIKETDLWISAKRDLSKETKDLVLNARHQIESYIEAYPEFLTSLSPWNNDPFAPPIVREMIDSARKASVGPMAAVAGAIAEYVGKRLLRLTDEVIVENGGDIFMRLNRAVTVSVFSEPFPNIGIIIKEDVMPVGICSSSGKIGHSLSFGKSDIVSVISSSASLADATATSIANRIKEIDDLKKIDLWASQIEGIKGVLAILNGNISLWGDMEITIL